jgi:hypothetical protein
MLRSGKYGRSSNRRHIFPLSRRVFDSSLDLCRLEEMAGAQDSALAAGM